MRPKTRGNLVLAAVAVAGLACASTYLPFPRARLKPGPSVSLRLTDRRGVLLREVLSEAGGRSAWLSSGAVPPDLVRATVAAEDRSFFAHGGLSLPSIARALAQDLRRGRIVSGASTITQQTVRNILPSRRTLVAKAREAWMALRLEHTLSKSEILLQYLNRACYGNSAYGAEAAARLYFDKPASLLSLAESAYLAVLPRSPSAVNPGRGPETALRRQKALLEAMAGRGWVSRDEALRAEREPIRPRGEGTAFRAPHFCEAVLAAMDPDAKSSAASVRTTLDAALQDKVEALLDGHVRALAAKGVTNGAVIVLDNATGEVLAMAGSRDFLDEAASGQVNGALSPRQPGSALKPFLYALALEKGWTPATLLDDVPDEFPAPGGAYQPRNYDRSFHGRVRLRTALACSYNVPAVRTAAEVGDDVFLARLRRLGFEGLDRPPDHYGLGLSLGNGEVTLLELAGAYASLARGGLRVRERMILAVARKDGRTVPLPAVAAPERTVDERAAWLITNVLADRDARVPAFGYRSPLTLPFPCAAKTGTSKDSRDNWAAGYTTRVTVAVWIGNFDGTPMRGISGVTGCGPLFHDVMLAAHAESAPGPFPEPPGIVRRTICPASGELARPDCPGAMAEVFAEGAEPATRCGMDHRPAETLPGAAVRAEWTEEVRFQPPPAEDRRSRPARKVSPFKDIAAVSILSPSDGSIYKLDPVLRAEFQAVRLKARAPEGAGEIEWRVDGRSLGRAALGASLSWRLSPGSHTIEARDAAGAARSAAVRITVIE